MKTKLAIGCLVQWYECDIIEEYVESLKDAINAYDGEVIVDFTISTNEELEKCISAEKKNECIEKIGSILLDFDNVRTTNKLHTIADYRRKFNIKYCTKVDVLMWGESDALIPQQTFNILDNLHQQSIKINNPKYLAFFSTCKMWDNSWKQLEHPDFTDKPFFDSPKDFKPDQWWSLRYTMSKKEMNEINNKTEDLDVITLPQHKFNGCGLVISSEVIKAGVNIPKSVFFVHEDSAFMYMTNKVLGNIPQYVIKNILLVHNRNHPEKRNHVKGESGDTLNLKRRSNDWYIKANQMCEQNYINLFNSNYKSFTWNDVWKS
tara:strand:- start:1979 stop:2935 length:957 start_codon:yes stop_codon:yes gene_type:complete